MAKTQKQEVIGGCKKMVKRIRRPGIHSKKNQPEKAYRGQGK